MAGAARSWLGQVARAREADIETALAGLGDVSAVARWTAGRLDASRRLHERECWNLNPAANVMDPRAEALLAAGAGTRPSLGHAGEKYETGLEELEQVEVAAAALAREVFGARHAEVRMPTGATANLAAFLALSAPGDAIVAPPATIGGHVTHHRAGVAGLLARRTVDAPVDAARHTVDLDRLVEVVRTERPAIVTLGTSCNLQPHPVREVAAIADEVGAVVVYDAAHVAGLVAGGVWPSPLEQGAAVVSMSTYKSLAGPPGGLLLTDDDDIARRLDEIAHPGLTANFDVGRVAALAVTLAGWRDDGPRYARAMTATATAFAQALLDAGAPVHTTAAGPTASHVVALDCRGTGGGDVAARRLRRARLLASAIGLPVATADALTAGLRLGVNELVRFGIGPADVDVVARFVAAGLAAGDDDLDELAASVTAHRRDHTTLHHLGAD